MKMLDVFDEFVQIDTMFKVGLFAQRIGLISGIKAAVLDTDYFDQQAIAHFEETYVKPAGVTLLAELPKGNNRIVVAGRGALIF